MSRALMAQKSAGILLYRLSAGTPELFLVHPGGPFWAKKDDGAWSIPKGLYEEGEPPLEAAKREFREETGLPVDGEFVPLGDFRQPGGKIVSAWLVEADCDAAAVKSNLFAIEWPPRSGKTAEFPEIDRAGWFSPEEAMIKIVRGQKPIIESALPRLVLAVRKN
jgi:predicted NUDIX family NTP pyrophosphohydrolase